MTVRTHDLEGFIKVLELLTSSARERKLIACSINLDPDGFGHYSFKLLDGTAMPGLTELEPAPHERSEDDTRPGRRKR